MSPSTFWQGGTIPFVPPNILWKNVVSLTECSNFTLFSIIFLARSARHYVFTIFVRLYIYKNKPQKLFARCACTCPYSVLVPCKILATASNFVPSTLKTRWGPWSAVWNWTSKIISNSNSLKSHYRRSLKGRFCRKLALIFVCLLLFVTSYSAFSKEPPTLKRSWPSFWSACYRFRAAVPIFRHAAVVPSITSSLMRGGLRHCSLRTTA